MVLVKCKACSKRYDYHQHGCCPECGAYNRPPQRNRVGADGVVHHMKDADFLDNTQRRRSSQGGKVCFEQDVCFEDQARRVRSGEKPWAKMAKETTSHLGGTARRESREKSGTRRIIGIVISVILATNVLPLLLTMCSATGVVGEIVDELFDKEISWEKPVEVVPATPAPDLTGIPEITPGQTFLWWGADARVTELTVNEADEGTKVDLTLWVEEPYDKPTAWYQTWTGEWVEADCEYVSELSDDHYTYYFYLPERLPGSESFVLFAGQTGDVWCRSKLLLTEGTVIVRPDDVITLDRTFADMGEPFLWWGEEVWVEGADIVQGNPTEVLLTLRGNVDFDTPSIVYWNRGGNQVAATWCDEYGQETDGWWYYRFSLENPMDDSDCWAVFADDGSAQNGAVWVLLTDALQTQPADGSEWVVLHDLTLETSGKTTKVEVVVQQVLDAHFTQPTLRYTENSGMQQEAKFSSYMMQGENATYIFRVKNMDTNGPFDLCFADSMGWQQPIIVPLN